MIVAAAVMVSCSNDDGDAGITGKNPNAKIVRQIKIYDYDESGNEDYYNILEFEYDSQNRVIKFTDEGSSTSFFYSGNTVTVQEDWDDDTQICTLNSDGNIISLKYYEYFVKHTYIDGFLNQCNADGDIYTYIWQDNNIVSIKNSYFDSNFKYGSQTTAPINLDIFYLICFDYEIMYDYVSLMYGLCGFYGKSTQNLPSQFTTYEDGITRNCEYEFNTDGTVSKMSIFSDRKYGFVVFELIY